MIEALDRVSVEQSDQCPDGFQLTFTDRQDSKRCRMN
jgi:hypothetical protein